MDAKSRANFINSIGTGRKIPCPNCDTLNDPDDLFCSNCGTKLIKPAMNTEESVDSAAETEPAVPAFQPAFKEAESSAPAFKPAEEEPVSTAPAFQPAAPAFRPAPKETENTAPAFSAAVKEAENSAPAFRAAISKTARSISSLGETAKEKTNNAPVFSPVAPAPVVEEEPVSVFAQGLPDWDMLPPQVMVRRKKK